MKVLTGFVVCLALCIGCAAQAAEVPDAVAAHLLSLSGRSNGLCLVPRAGGGSVPLSLARQPGLLIHALCADAKDVVTLQSRADAAGVFGRSLCVETGTLSALPHPDNHVDLVVLSDLCDADLTPTLRQEILRVLAPGIGVAVLGQAKGGSGSLSKAKLEAWTAASGSKNARVIEDAQGLWTVMCKPPLPGAADWSHWFGGADNNPSTHDTVFKLPANIAWYGKPYNYGRNIGGRVAANGRLFMAYGPEKVGGGLNLAYQLTARNIYNGVVLWKRQLPDTTWMMRSFMVATEKALYVMEGASVAVVDPGTGKDLDRISFEGVTGQGKWLALSDGVLLVLVGEPDPKDGPTRQANDLKAGKVGLGTTILAYDAAKKKLLWKHEEAKLVDCRQIAAGNGHVYFQSPDSRAGCLDLRSGKLVWENKDPEVIQTIDQSVAGDWMAMMCVGLDARPGMLCTPEIVALGAPEKKTFVTLSAKDGKLLWKSARTTGTRAMNFLVRDNKLYVHEIKNRGILNPLTGEVLGNFGAGGCGVFTATDNVFCTQVGGAGGGYPIKTSCPIGTFVADGVFIAPPTECQCPFARGYVAMEPGDPPVMPTTNTEYLIRGSGDATKVAPLSADAKDWVMYRGNVSHSGATPVAVSTAPRKLWTRPPCYDPALVGNGVFNEESDIKCIEPVTVGPLTIVGATDGRLQCLESASGKTRWTFYCGPILATPTIWEGRVYVGSVDGNVYAVEATTGRLLWRFRVAPNDRKILVYGYLQSPWPVSGSVVVQDGVAYAASGLLMQPGASVVAFDAVTGKLKWRNAEISASYGPKGEFKAGTEPYGQLAMVKGKLWARVFGRGGVAFDPQTGQIDPVAANLGGGVRGQNLGILDDAHIVAGGPELYANNREPGYNGRPYVVATLDATGKVQRAITSHNPDASGAMPAWNTARFVIGLCFPGKLFMDCWDTAKLAGLQSGGAISGNAAALAQVRLWGPTNEYARAVALAGNAVVATVGTPSFGANGSTPRNWRIKLFKLEDGSMMWEEALPCEPIRDAIAIDREGRIIICLSDGSIVCYGDK